jgi:hypothetical protein
LSEDKDNNNIKNNVIQFPKRDVKRDDGQDSWKLDDVWTYNKGDGTPKDLSLDNEEKVHNFVEALVEEHAINYIKTSVDADINIEHKDFYKDLAFITDMYRAATYRNFDIQHISQKVVDKLVSLEKYEGKYHPVIDYRPIITEKDYNNMNPDQMCFDFYKENLIPIQSDIEIDFVPDMEWLDPEDDQ